MAGIKTMHEAFLHELSDAYDAERQFTQAMQEMLGMAQDPQVKQGLQQHLQETEQQIKNVEQVFQQLGARPKRKPCPGIEGIRAEFEEASKGDGGSPELRDLHLLGPAARTEHYEIAAYEGLVTMAKAMGESKAANLLEKNLKQEQAMLRDGKTTARRLAGKVAKAENDTTTTKRSTTRSSTKRTTTRGSTRKKTTGGTSRSRASRGSRSTRR